MLYLSGISLYTSKVMKKIQKEIKLTLCSIWHTTAVGAISCKKNNKATSVESRGRGYAYVNRNGPGQFALQPVQPVPVRMDKQQILLNLVTRSKNPNQTA